MFGLLLILWKNGWSSTIPYGVKHFKYNMSHIFLYITITIISCSVCASGDLEIFPDQKFDLSSEEQRPSYEDPNGFYRRPFKSLNYVDFDEIKRKIDLIDYLDQVTKDEEPSYYRNLDAIDYGNEKTRLRNYILGLTNNQNNYEFAEPRPYPMGEDFPYLDDYEDEKKDDTVTQREASGKGELDVSKNDEDQFAYPPSDPRFFQNQASDNDIKLKASPKKDNKIYVRNRSDERFRTNSEARSDDIVNDSNLEVVAVKPSIQNSDSAGVYIIAIVAGISAAATVGLIAVGIGWYNLQKHVKNASDVEYPAYGITGPNKDVSPSGDRRLAQSAQMYHYQHQKQQIIAMESRAAAGERPASVSDADSDEENEEGDYTVYECPGLAPTGEMEVKNPLFQDDPTPAQTPQVKNNTNEAKK